MSSKRIAALVASVFILSITAYSQTKLLRFPDIRGDRVVFTYAGDLWTAPSTGGNALRLTSHPGVEVFGKFSPDGKWIAFTGQYDGDELTIAFNARFLIEMLNAADSSDVKMELSTSTRAGILKPTEQQDGEELLMLVMPLMLNQ